MTVFIMVGRLGRAVKAGKLRMIALFHSSVKILNLRRTTADVSCG
jgi:hypothetical protein